MTPSARDLIERVVWTFVSAALAALAGASVLGIDAAQAALMAGLSAAINAVLVIARWRLSVLPDPGAGLPGLPTDRGE